MTGEKYSCSPDLKNEVLAMSFQEQSIPTIRTKLSQVIHATWKQTFSGWTLEQTTDQKDEEKRWNTEDRWGKFQENLDYWRALDSGPEWDSATAAAWWKWSTERIDPKNPSSPTRSSVEHERVRQTMPIGHFMTDFCKLADFSKLNLMDDSVEIPIINSRNIELLGITKFSLNRLIHRFEREENLYDNVIPRKNFKPDGPFEFEIKIDKSQDLITASITMFGKQEFGHGDLIGPHKYAKYQPTPEPFQQSKLGKQMEESLREENRYWQPEESKRKSQPNAFQGLVWSSFLRAETVDPLGIYEGRCWLEVASEKKMPLMVALHEPIDYPPFPTRVPAVAQTGRKLGMTRIDQDGWVLGKPLNPLRNRILRTPRHIVQAYAEYLFAKKPLSIDEQARMIWLGSAHRIPAGEFLRPRQFGPLSAIYGSFDPSTQRQLRSGKSMPVSNLSSGGQKIIRELYFRGSLNQLGPGSHLLTLYGERPSEVLPNGVSGMTFASPERLDPAFEVIETDAKRKYSLGQFVAHCQFQHQMADFWQDFLKDLRFRIAYSKAVYPTIQLGNRKVFEVLTETPGTYSKVYKWKTMPPEVKKRVLTCMQQDESGEHFWR